MVIYSAGHLNIGTENDWNELEQELISLFDQLNEKDFNLALAGFCNGKTKTGSTTLRKYFSMVVLENFKDNYVEFIKAAYILSKDKDRPADPLLWDVAEENCQKYLALPHCQLTIICLYLKTLAKFKEATISK